MFARDVQGNLRKFGSRRHYCFSHLGYREQCRDIVTRLAERYGSHPALGAWQTDNEYGCHDTTLSYSDAARIGFQKWLANKYGNDISKLNAAWGNVFWSMEYASILKLTCQTYRNRGEPSPLVGISSLYVGSGGGVQSPAM